MAADVNVGTYTRSQTFPAHVRVELIVPGRGSIGSVVFEWQWIYDYATEEVHVFHGSGGEALRAVHPWTLSRPPSNPSQETTRFARWRLGARARRQERSAAIRQRPTMVQGPNQPIRYADCGCPVDPSNPGYCSCHLYTQPEEQT